MTLVFENRDTVRFQIQEMLRVERIVQPDKVQHEIGRLQRAAAGAGRGRGDALHRDHRPGPHPGDPRRLHRARRAGTARPADRRQRPIRRSSRPGRAAEDRISAVHYIRFPLGAAGREALASGAEAALEVAHGRVPGAAGASPETVGGAGPGPRRLRAGARRAAGPGATPEFPQEARAPEAAALSQQTARSSTGSSADQATPARASAAIPRGPTRTCLALSTIHSRGVDRRAARARRASTGPSSRRAIRRSARRRVRGLRLRARPRTRGRAAGPPIARREGRRAATARAGVRPRDAGTRGPAVALRPVTQSTTRPGASGARR